VRYDGRTFQTHDRRDGLAINAVNSIYQDREGRLWFATTAGITRYTPRKSLRPSVRLEAVAHLAQSVRFGS